MFPFIQRWRFALFSLWLVIPQIAGATNIVVTTNTDAVGVNGSLRQALQFNAFLGGGNTIVFSNTVTGVILLSQGELLVDHDVSIVGPGGKVLAINGNHASRVIHINGNFNVSLSGLTITNGSSATGGSGILGDNGNLTMTDCAIVGNSNSGGQGGGINKSSGNTTLINCLIASNSAPASSGGGIIGGLVLMTNCTVAGNSAGNGGGIYTLGNFRLVHCTVSGNIANTGGNTGGGIFQSLGTVTIGNSIIAGNTATTSPDGNGGFVSAGYNLIGNTSGASGFGTIGDQLNVNPLLGPLQDNGGPTLTRALLPGSPAIDQGTSSGTTADQRGRARPFVNNPSATLPFGGDFSDIGAYELSPVDFVVTTTNEHGIGSLRQMISDASGADRIIFGPGVAGTIVLTNGELVAGKQLSIVGPANNRIVISGNNASRVFRVTAGGNLSISGLTIANGNSAGQGGAAFNESGSTLTLSNCTISANVTGDNGGGVANNGTLAAYNCTFTGNRAASTGGAIYTYAGPVLLRNCTIVSNSTVNAEGGGLCNYSPIVGTSNNIGSTIVAGNSAPGHADVVGVFTSAGYNLIGKIDYSTPSVGPVTGVLTRGLTNGVNHDQVGSVATPINPLIDALQDNGGTTPTVKLLPGSPAINTGTNNGLLADQRGAPRPDPSSGLSDIGAYEANLPPIVTSTNDFGVGSLRETISDYVFGDPITFATNVVGTIVLTNGQLVMNKTVSIMGPANGHLVISGNNTSRVFLVTGGGSIGLSGLTIANGNSAAQGGGAFIDFGCSLTLSNCAVLANTTGDNGGGIANNGSFAAYNCTFSGNQAFTAGGAIYTYAGPVVLRNCTVVSNSCLNSDGGGLCDYSLVGGTSNYLSSTLVAGNSASNHADVIGIVTSGGYNLIGQMDYGIPTNGAAFFVPTGGITNGVNHDQAGSPGSPLNPLTGSLRDNGGPTFTIAPLPGSPAIDAGTNNGLTTDQRGAPRSFDFATVANASGSDGSDIGAFELGTPQLAIQPVTDKVVISWPAYYGGFTLQSAPNLGGPNNWLTAVGVAAVIGNQYYVTNTAAGGNNFYRLSFP